MKRLIILLIVVIVVSSCCNSPSRLKSEIKNLEFVDHVHITDETNRQDCVVISKFMYNEHSILQIRSLIGGYQYIHDPDCEKCIKRQNNNSYPYGLLF